MRDIFEDIFANQPLDPTEAARRNMRPNLRARFYKDATVGEGRRGGFPVLLDGRAVRTPARKPLAAPVQPLAQAIAAEWSAQEKVVDPATMPLTRLANSIIDGVAPAPAPVADEIEKYLGTDLLFYRASEPDGLVALQRKHWDPVVDWARDALGARFVLAEGVMHVAQPRGGDRGGASRKSPARTIRPVTGGSARSTSPPRSPARRCSRSRWPNGRLSPDEAWTAAHVDEDWNMQFWGRDELALQRRDYRRKEFDAAAPSLPRCPANRAFTASSSIQHRLTGFC